MEPYRHALYRYSTGKAFSPTVAVPTRAEQVASYSGKPLIYDLQNFDFAVDIKRESDRLSMQLEDLMRQVRNLGYDKTLGSNISELRSRISALSDLLLSKGIKSIKREDLNEVYRNLSDKQRLKNILDKVAAYNTDKSAIKTGVAMYDTYGKRLDKQDISTYKKDVKTLQGFGDTTSTASMLFYALVGLAVLKLVRR